MARLEAFDRELRLATRDLEPEAIGRALAATARAALAEVLQQQRARAGGIAPRYERFVNGREGAAEESVVPPGPIVYEFDYLAEIAAFALDFLRAQSPKRSGRYRESHFLMAAGQALPGGPAAIPQGAAFTITNDQPYARKIEVGAMQTSVPPGLYERARQQVRARYGALVSARVVFVDLAGGYVDRRGRNKGQQMRYPALLVTPR